MPINTRVLVLMVTVLWLELWMC